MSLPQNKIDSVMGKLSRYDTVFLGADKPDLQQISQQIDRLEQSKTELAEIEKLIIEIEVCLHSCFRSCLKLF